MTYESKEAVELGQGDIFKIVPLFGDMIEVLYAAVNSAYSSGTKHAALHIFFQRPRERGQDHPA